MKSTEINSENFEFTQEFKHITDDITMLQPGFEDVGLELMRIDFKLKFTVGGREHKPVQKAGFFERLFAKDEQISDQLFSVSRTYTNECIMDLSEQEIGELVKKCYFELFLRIKDYKEDLANREK